ncbi:MAG TPA: thiamine-phosphate kinase [Pyrinomonadaceae bacterium]|nr:thiamine-phosphate kinase [Pyrinomonadaceae bacterium]
MPTEFQFIENLKKKYSLTKIGDDCAVLPKDSHRDLVITTDLLVEDIDFRLKWSTPEFIGHKALAVSLSDVAAMGAKPVWSMVSIGVPEHVWKTDFVDEFYEGYLNLAKKYGVELIGGDVSKTPDKIVVDSIAAGEVEIGKAIFRSGAKAGDLIFVTGELGGAATGLKLLEKGFRYNDSLQIWQQNLLLKQLQPSPRISEGQDLSKIATAMIDLSDGLSSDLAHICHQSKVGAKIFADKIPIDSNLNELVQDSEQQVEYAINGGEDFELLFTVSPKVFFERQSFIESRGFSLIGEVTANEEIIELITGKKLQILEPKGFRHF